MKLLDNLSMALHGMACVYFQFIHIQTKDANALWLIVLAMETNCS